MKGFRTIVLASFPLVWAGLSVMGIDVPLEEQADIIAGVTAIMMIAMRSISDTPVGKDS